MLGGDGERRVYQEQGGGEEERGAVLRAPQVPRDQPAAAAGRSRDVASFRSTDVLGALGAARGARGGAGSGEHGVLSGACAGPRRAAYPHRILHPRCGAARPWQPDRLLRPGPPCWLPGCFQSRHMPGSPGSSSGQLEPEVFPKCLTPSCCSARPGGASGAEGCCGSPSPRGAHPSRQHPSLRAPLPVPGQRVGTGAAGEGDVPSGARSVLLQARVLLAGFGCCRGDSFCRSQPACGVTSCFGSLRGTGNRRFPWGMASRPRAAEPGLGVPGRQP